MVSTIDYFATAQSDDYYDLNMFTVSEIVDRALGQWTDADIAHPGRQLDHANLGQAFEWLRSPKTRLNEIVEALRAINIQVLGIEFISDLGDNLEEILDQTDVVWAVWFEFDKKVGFYIPEGVWEFDKYDGVGVDELESLLANLN